MPQGIPIAAFVFSAVLPLIAVLGGKFKIFGAEISGTGGRTGPSFAAVLGTALIVVGLIVALQQGGPSPGPQPPPPGPQPGSGPGTATILSFQAAHSQIKERDTAQLQWAVQDVSSVVIGKPGSGTKPRGRRPGSHPCNPKFPLSMNRK
jgi:hypothetical protein